MLLFVIVHCFIFIQSSANKIKHIANHSIFNASSDKYHFFEVKDIFDQLIFIIFIDHKENKHEKKCLNSIIWKH